MVTQIDKTHGFEYTTKIIIKALLLLIFVEFLLYECPITLIFLTTSCIYVECYLILKLL